MNYRGNMGGMYSMLNQQRMVSNTNSLFGMPNPRQKNTSDEISNELFQGQQINPRTFQKSNPNMSKK